MTAKLRALTAEQKQQFDQEGYLVVKGLFTAHNLEEIEQTFRLLGQPLPVPGQGAPV